MAMSGATCAFSYLYSQEFGAAAAIGCAILLTGLMVETGGNRELRLLGIWGGAGVAGGASVMFLMFGHRIGEFLRLGSLVGYGADRLMGHHVLPLESFPWDFDLQHILMHPAELMAWSAIWAPILTMALLIGIMVTWRRKEGVCALALQASVTTAALIAAVPVVARPNVQVATSMPFLAVLLVVFLRDMGEGGQHRLLATALAAVWLTLSVGAIAVIWPVAGSKYSCFSRMRLTPSERIPRLGSVSLLSSGADRDIPVINYLHRSVPPGKRIFVAAPYYSHLLFLADRAGVPRYMTTEASAGRQRGKEMIDALERFKPPVVLLENQGVDVPFAAEQPDLASYIATHYRLGRQFGELRVLKRVGPAGKARASASHP